MVGVQDEEHVEGPLQHGVHLVAVPHPEHHLEEVPAVAQVVVGIGVGQAHGVTVGEGSEGGDLGDEPVDLLATDERVVDLLGLRVEGRERPHRGHQHAHGVRVVAEPGHEVLDVLVDDRVVRDLVDPVVVLGPGGQLAVQDEVGDLQVGPLLRQLLDRVAAVAQDPLVAVDEGDPAAAGGGVHESGVVAHQAKIVGRDLDLPQVHGLDGPVLDGDLVALPRPVVDEGHGIFAPGSRGFAPGAGPSGGQLGHGVLLGLFAVFVTMRLFGRAIP